MAKPRGVQLLNGGKPPTGPGRPEKTQRPSVRPRVDETQAKAQVSPANMKGKLIIFAAITAISSLTKIQSVICTRKPKLGGRFQDQAMAKTVKDPVCGLEVATGPAKQAGRTSEYQGKIYYFDTEGCKRRFDQDPQYYLSGSPEPTLPHAYPLLPTNPDLLLRLRRDSIRAIPPGKNLALPAPPRAG